MDSQSIQLILLGILYILVFIAGIFSVSKTVDAADYLRKSTLNSGKIKRAAGFQFLLGIFYISILALFYPILASYNSELTITFLILRGLAVIFVIIGALLLFKILKISRAYQKNDNKDEAIYSQRGNLIKKYRDLINHVGMIIPLCLGSIVLYLGLFQAELIPLWLCSWGIFAAGFAILASILVLTKQLKIISTTYIVLNLPLILQEITFAIWLILMGLGIIAGADKI